MPFKPVLLWALCSLSLPLARASEPASLPKAIQVGALPRPCTWINRPLAFSLDATNELTITAGRKTDLYNGLVPAERTTSAPMLVFAPNAAFVLTAKVSVDFQQEFDGGFLALFVDGGHWAKLLFERSHYGSPSVCSNVTKGDTDECVNGDVPGKEVYLRITRDGDLFTFYSSPEGRTWTYIRLFRFPVKGDLKVGFGSQSPLGERCTTRFTNIHYSPKGSSDFWTGAPGKP